MHAKIVLPVHSAKQALQCVDRAQSTPLVPVRVNRVRLTQQRCMQEKRLRIVYVLRATSQTKHNATHVHGVNSKAQFQTQINAYHVHLGQQRQPRPVRCKATVCYVRNTHTR